MTTCSMSPLRQRMIEGRNAPSSRRARKKAISGLWPRPARRRGGPAQSRRHRQRPEHHPHPGPISSRAHNAQGPYRSGPIGITGAARTATSCCRKICPASRGNGGSQATTSESPEKPDEPNLPAHPCPSCGGHMVIIETFGPGQQPQQQRARDPPSCQGARP